MANKTISAVLKEQGRTQKFLLDKLKERGYNIDAPALSRYANGLTESRNPKMYYDIAEILMVKLEEIVPPKHKKEETQEEGSV